MRARLRLALLPLPLAGCFLFSHGDPPPRPAPAPAAVAPAEPDEEVEEPAPPPLPAPPPAPVVVEITLEASPRLNPDEHGDALPTAVFLYQLKSARKLDAAGFEEIYGRAREVLGDDVLQSDELVLAPGQVQTRTFEREKGARALAVVALVRRPEGRGFCNIVTLPEPGQSLAVTFFLDLYRVERSSQMSTERSSR